MVESKMGQTEFEVKKRVVIPELRFEIGEFDYICPLLFRMHKYSGLGDHKFWVDKEYCDSFCFGEGCRNKDTCPNYPKNK